jgi:hypothetical protein
VFSELLGWIVLRTRADGQEEIEIQVLRRHLAVLRRTHATTANEASVARLGFSRAIRSANARGVARRADA